MKFDSFEIRKEPMEELFNLCPPNEYRAIPPSQLPAGLLPTALTNKYNDVTVLHTALQLGERHINIIVANGTRVDYRASALDQQPYGGAFEAGKPTGSGWLAQHPNYSGRSTPIPIGLYSQASVSGLGNCYPHSQLPSQVSGNLGDLNDSSQMKALDVLVTQVLKFTGHW